MQTRSVRSLLSFALLASAFLAGGCAMFRSSASDINVNQAQPMDANYDYSDLRNLGAAVADELCASDLIRSETGKPIFVVMGVQNRTGRHIDTKALTDTIRTKVIQGQKADFVNESQRDTLLREQGYQLNNCTPETRVAVGRQLGARYMLTGSLVELKKTQPPQVRVSKTEEVYYQLTVEVTDLQTSLIAWTTQKERARTASRPLIGW
jgi:uncharacterized protein (TIGR02722 family)